jgi:hypothetical protein
MNKDQATNETATVAAPAKAVAPTAAKAAKVLTSEQVDKLITTDEFAGQGGDYEIRNGVRVRVSEPTADHPEGNCARNHEGKRIVDIEREAAEAAAAEAK